MTITDNDAPVVTAHANVTAEATGASGATVTYSAAAATDNVGVTSKTYSQNSGTVFPIGTTTVTITAKDAANNAGTGIFTVTVQDTTAPVVAAHPNVTVEATSDAGAMVNYVAATATDAVGVTSVEYSQNSGTVFPIGMTTVTVTAKDAANNTGTATFTVTVRDTTAPVVGTHADVGPVEATSAAGSTVNYTPATATDAVTANPTITYSRNSGTVFPIGTTTVTVTAKDAANNSGTGTFKVTVRDTTAPTISAPESGFAPLTLTVSQGGKVALPNFTTQAVTSDNVGVSSVTQSPAPATPIAEGTTQVTLTAHDAAANTAVLSFTITVLVSGKATVVTKGAAVPGAGVDPRIPAGTTWGAFGVPTITMEGMKAGWLASALTPPRGSFHGIFTGSILAPTLRLRTGDFAMDQAGTVVAGVTFKSFREPVFAGDDFAVVAMVKGLHVSAANDTGMWFGEGGTVKEIAREGAVAPGTSVKFKAFTSLAMPTPGTVFFVATLAAPATKDMSLWVWTPADGLKLALRDGDSVPSAGGAILKSFVALSSVNGSFGHGRYDADAPALDVRLSFADPDHTTAMGTVATDGSVMVTQRSGQTDPNGRVPVSFGVPSSPGQGLGATAVTTFAPDAAHGITPTSMVTIYDYEDGLIRAQQGMIAPGAEPTTFKSFRDPVSGYGFDGGRVQFFAATLAGAVRTGDTGLWAFTSSLAPVAREGAEPPGAVGTKWKSFTSLSVLEGRGPMFTAKLASGTERVTAANDAGLWAMDSTGALRLIFRKGDVLPGGKLKSFTLLGAVTGSPGQRRAWTIGDASARVIYLAFFTDGSSAILSTAVP